MEYLASGIPVVMFHLPGIPAEYDEYLYYAGEDYGGLSKTLIYVMDHPKEAVEKASYGRRFILDEKNSVVQARKVYSLVKSNV